MRPTVVPRLVWQPYPWPLVPQVKAAHHSPLSPLALDLLILSNPTDKARDRRTGKIVALKRLRLDRERDGGLAVCRGDAIALLDSLRKLVGCPTLPLHITCTQFPNLSPTL